VCSFVPTYSFGVLCFPGEEEEEHDYLLDNTDGYNFGGGVSSLPDTTVSITVDTSILSNPNVKCIVDSLIDGVVGKIFKDLLPAGTHLIIKLGELPLDKNGATLFNPSSNTFTIKLNSVNALDNSLNRILIAKTIIHEYFHVVLQQWVINATGTNNLLWISTHLHNIEDATTIELLSYYHQYSIQEGTWNIIGHQWLANHFEYLTGLLKQYVQTYYPSVANNNIFGMKPYYALMGAGLEDVECIFHELQLRGIVIPSAEFNNYFSHLSSYTCPE
jgi:hypothetical protein